MTPKVTVFINIFAKYRFLFDLFKVIPYHSLPPEKREELWDDGVHFTSKGYDVLGGYLATRLTEIVSSSKDTHEIKDLHSTGELC